MAAVRAALYIGIVVLLVLGSAFLIYTYTRRVTGISMLPTLEEGDLVVMQPVAATSVSVGNIIVYDPPCSATGTPVIHRVVNVQGPGFITKGDNNGMTDETGGIATGPVTPTCLEGRVVFVAPYVELLTTLPYGANYILAVLVVLLVLYGELRAGGAGGKEGVDAEENNVTMTEEMEGDSKWNARSVPLTRFLRPSDTY